MSQKETSVASVDAYRLIASENYLGRADFMDKQNNLIEREFEIEDVLAVVQDWHPKNGDVKPDVVLQFKGEKKRLKANKTNLRKLISKFGGGTPKDKWVGKKVTMLFTEVEPETGKEIRNPKDPKNPGGVRIK